MNEQPAGVAAAELPDLAHDLAHVGRRPHSADWSGLKYRRTESDKAEAERGERIAGDQAAAEQRRCAHVRSSWVPSPGAFVFRFWDVSTALEKMLGAPSQSDVLRLTKPPNENA